MAMIQVGHRVAGTVKYVTDQFSEKQPKTTVKETDTAKRKNI
jgi:hypothetical protein